MVFNPSDPLFYDAFYPNSNSVIHSCLSSSLIYDDSAYFKETLIVMA